jgi:hypothetical protein
MILNAAVLLGQRHFLFYFLKKWLGIFPVIEYICNSVANAKQLRIIGVVFPGLDYYV